MKLSSRSKYGFRAVLELALSYGKGPLQIKAIAEHEDISNKYLEQLIAMLKVTGLVRSIRGPKGGYILAKPPKDITLTEVFRTLEGPFIPVECLEHPQFSSKCADCVTREVWNKLQKSLLNVLDSTNLQDLVNMAQGTGKKGS